MTNPFCTKFNKTDVVASRQQNATSQAQGADALSFSKDRANVEITGQWTVDRFSIPWNTWKWIFISDLPSGTRLIPIFVSRFCPCRQLGRVL
jgi:hypothetical protein